METPVEYINLKVSAVITAYNYGRFVSDAINSVLNQTHKNIEVIVVDDGSTDDTKNKIEPFANRVLYVYQKNAGVAAARNRGVEMSTGDFIFCLDADDAVSPHYVEDAMKIVENEKTIVSPLVFHTDIDLNPMGGSWPDDYTMNTNSNTLFDIIVSNRAPICSIYSRKMWEEVGGYDGFNDEFKGAEDWDFWINMIHHGCYIKYLRAREPYFLYRKHGESMITKFHREYDSAFNHILKKYNMSAFDIIQTLYDKGR